MCIFSHENGFEETSFTSYCFMEAARDTLAVRNSTCQVGQVVTVGPRGQPT